jgi:signal transduction histidine kinase
VATAGTSAQPGGPFHGAAPGTTAAGAADAPRPGATGVASPHGELLDAVLAIASDLSLPAVLRRLTEAACRLTGARYGALGVIGQGGSLKEFLTVGADAQTIGAIGHPPKGLGILGLLIVEPQPLRLHDLAAHPESAGFPPGHPPMHTFLGVPVRVRGEVFGNLYLTDKQAPAGVEGPVDFTADDEQVASMLAAAAAVAIENARFHTLARDHAVVVDRERIARELHDTVIQRLFATGLSLQSARRGVADPDLVRRIDAAVDELDTTIRQMRAAVFELEASERSGRGLRSDVLGVVRDSVRALGFEPEVSFIGAVDAVPEGIADHLLAVAREALSNVARHADARRGRIAVSVDERMVSLQVDDDGRGLPAGGAAAGHGLRNLTRRAQALGGGVSLAAGALGGVSLRWWVPLDPAARLSDASADGWVAEG